MRSASTTPSPVLNTPKSPTTSTASSPLAKTSGQPTCPDATTTTVGAVKVPTPMTTATPHSTSLRTATSPTPPPASPPGTLRKSHRQQVRSRNRWNGPRRRRHPRSQRRQSPAAPSQRNGNAEQGFDKEVSTVQSLRIRGISRRHFNDVSTAYIQESQPTSVSVSGSDATVFRGCLWFKESTGQLYMYNGNAWHIVAGGQLTSENLRFMGTYNADTNQFTLTDEGTAEQF